MPTSFLSEEQRRRFGHFTEDPDEGQLAGSFLLDQTARRRAMAARGARNRIGWAVQLGTIRYLGTFLENPEKVPAVVFGYVAEQLGLEPDDFAGYGTSEARWDHQEQIREGYGYTKFEFDQWFALARWLYQRAWIGNERPTLLFDLVTKRLVDKKVVLPGVTVLERLVSGTRERAEKRLWATLAAAPSAEPAVDVRAWRWTADLFHDVKMLNEYGAQGWEVDRVDAKGLFVSARDPEHPQQWEYRRELVTPGRRRSVLDLLAPDGWEPCGTWVCFEYFKRPRAASLGPAAELTAPPRTPRRNVFLSPKFYAFVSALLVLTAVALVPLLRAAGAEIDGSDDSLDAILGLLTGAAVGALAMMVVLWLAVRRRGRRR
ncbi:hypothetical protein FHR32_006026 [Streptosporangium album]|uniref:DUF4158 domain-containing protein n=1 Tax=Streptosporangium album TaxID=47479 RepID=A0A7W7S0H5_9ACTN|nr:DUF4158 domain-containing protein [Streptosporangium album]MBB4941649.1 hypothetical protein [Streptosporangium album]